MCYLIKILLMHHFCLLCSFNAHRHVHHFFLTLNAFLSEHLQLYELWFLHVNLFLSSKLDEALSLCTAERAVQRWETTGFYLPTHLSFGLKLSRRSKQLSIFNFISNRDQFGFVSSFRYALSDRFSLTTILTADAILQNLLDI